MYFYLTKVCKGSNFEILDEKGIQFTLEESYSDFFYFKKFKISPYIIPINSKIEYFNHNGMNSFLVHESDRLKLFQIYQIGGDGTLVCVSFAPNFTSRIIRIEELVWYADYSTVLFKNSQKLLGEYIIVNEELQAMILMTTKAELTKKKNISGLIWEKLGNSKISSIQEGYIVATLKGQQIFASLPDFLYMNNLNWHEMSTIIHKPVSIFQANKSIYFKLIPQKALIFAEYSFDFYEQQVPTINYPEDKSKNSILRLRCSDFPDVFNKLGFNFTDFKMSNNKVNSSLATIIGFWLFEHLIRFKNDEFFNKNIKQKFANANVSHIFGDFLNINSFKYATQSYENIESDLVNIKRIGEGILSLIQNDIETIEGLQDLADVTGCCIHFRNFTENFKQFKIVPINYNVKTRPIINLGKYFNDYFLLYPREFEEVDESFQEKDPIKSFQEKDPIKSFPFYDQDISKEENKLNSFLRGFCNKIKEIQNYIEGKISGKKVEVKSTNFHSEINLLDDYFLEKCGVKNIEMGQILTSLDFSETIYKLSGKKFFCNCGCVGYFDESSNPKKMCYCKREYKTEHLNIYYPDKSILCWCGKQRIGDILGFY